MRESLAAARDNDSSTALSHRDARTARRHLLYRADECAGTKQGFADSRVGGTLFFTLANPSSATGAKSQHAAAAPHAVARTMRRMRISCGFPLTKPALTAAAQHLQPTQAALHIGLCDVVADNEKKYMMKHETTPLIVGKPAQQITLGNRRSCH